MQKTLQHLGKDVIDFFLPRSCYACGSRLGRNEDHLCLSCELHLPVSSYFSYSDNPMEKLFWGRIPIKAAASSYFFDKGEVVQTLMHQLKYESHRPLAHWMGQKMALHAIQSKRFSHVEMVFAVPLHKKKQAIRGYNQSEWLIDSMLEKWKIRKGRSLKRVVFTESQTRKNKEERWRNVAGAFQCDDPKEVGSKHILLVDDVITTGSTLEACAKKLLQCGAASISIIVFASAQ